MTALEMMQAVGKVELIAFDEVLVQCEIIDAKTAWNRVRLLVRPVSGSGQQWVECGRVYRVKSTDGRDVSLPAVR